MSDEPTFDRPDVIGDVPPPETFDDDDEDDEDDFVAARHARLMLREPEPEDFAGLCEFEALLWDGDLARVPPGRIGRRRIRGRHERRGKGA